MKAFYTGIATALVLVITVLFIVSCAPYSGPPPYDNGSHPHGAEHTPMWFGPRH